MVSARLGTTVPDPQRRCAWEGKRLQITSTLHSQHKATTQDSVSGSGTWNVLLGEENQSRGWLWWDREVWLPETCPKCILTLFPNSKWTEGILFKISKNILLWAKASLNNLMHTYKKQNCVF